MTEFDKLVDEAMTAHGFKYQQQLLEIIGITRQTLTVWRRANDIERLKKALRIAEFATTKPAPLPQQEPLPTIKDNTTKVHEAVKNALLIKTEKIVRVVCEELHNQAIDAYNGEENSPKYLAWPDYRISIEANKDYEAELNLIDDTFGVSRSIKKIILSIEAE